MSLLWPERLTLLIHPQRVLLERRDFRGRVACEVATALPVADAAVWQGALSAALVLLERCGRRGSRLRIVVADHFVRYALLPWSETMCRPAERRAVALALFRSSLGEKADALGIKPLLRIVSQAVVGNHPDIMGFAPAPATRKAVAKAGLQLSDIDLFEINEAFASQAVAVVRDLGIPEEKVNVNGGAVALGHPVGATGTILVVKLMNEMKRRGSRYGVVSMCIGGGQGIATVFENLQG